MLKIRKYRPGDEMGFQKLDRMVELHSYNRRNIDNWFWKFKGDNPAGESIMIYAEIEGEIIGHFAAIPMNYWINGFEIIGSHSIAMMIDPKWQNKGLIKFVADKLINEIKERQLPFTYGYPNKDSYDLHVKILGYEEVFIQKQYIIPIKKNNNFFVSTKKDDYKWVKIERFDQSVDNLWLESRDDYKAIVIRDSKFLNWRYAKRPDLDYHIFGAYQNNVLKGYCILKKYKDEDSLRGHIIDIFTENNNFSCGNFLIEKSLEFFKGNKIDEATLWINGSTFIKKIINDYGFQEGGFVGAGWPRNQRPMICRFNFEKEKHLPFLNEKNWYFTMGDTLEIY